MKQQVNGESIVTCISDFRRGLDWRTHLLDISQVVTTINYNTSKITVIITHNASTISVMIYMLRD
jgi:hypothetical protein